jgi:signal transduction histidine kinase/ligand-binding sensor domain-containing protein/CheY-like chemotaxis protein
VKLTNLYYLLVFWTICLPLYAKESFRTVLPQVENISKNLSDQTGFVKAIAQDSHGIIWLTSSRGLFWYDGYRLNQILLDKKYSLFDMVVDNKNNLWISTLEGSLLKYNSKLGKTTEFNNEFLGFSEQQVELSKISLVDRKLWVTSGEGIIQINIDSEKVIQNQASMNEEISKISAVDILVDKDENLWITTFNHGIYFFDKNTHSLKKYSTANAEIFGFSSNKATSIFEDYKGTIWIGTFSGIYRFSREKDYFEKMDFLTDITVSDITSASEHAIWFSSWESGAIKYDLETEKYNLFEPIHNDNDSLISRQIATVFEDNNKNIWLGSDKGISKISYEVNKFKHIKTAEKNTCNIKATSKSINGFVYFSCDNIVYKFHPEKPDSVVTVLSTDDDIYKMDINTLGEIVLTFFRKEHVVIFNQQTGGRRIYRPTDSGLKGGAVLDIEIDSSNRIWVATYAAHLTGKDGGLYYYDENLEQFISALSNYDVLSITELSCNRYFLTTTQGIYLYDAQNSKLEHIEFLSHIDRVYSPFRDSMGNIWFSVFERGLHYFDVTTRTIKSVETINNLELGDITNISQSDDGLMWFTNSNKMVRFDLDNDLIKLYGNEDGIQLNGFVHGSLLLTEAGDFIVASNEGLAIFKATEKTGYEPQYNLILSNFNLLNKPIYPSYQDPESPLTNVSYETEYLSLSYDNYLFSFNFSMLGANKKYQVTYAYIMEGLDNDWIFTEATNRVATYTTLPSGNYRFRYKARIDQTWIEGSPIYLDISPPFWRSWIAYLFYVVAILFLITLFVHLRIKGLKKQTENLKQGVRERTKELQKKSDTIENLLEHKQVFFTNLSHEFKTPITLISSPITSLINEEVDERKISKLKLVENSARQLAHIVNQLLELAKLESKTSFKYRSYSLKRSVKYVTDSFQPLFLEREIKLIVHDFSDTTLKMTEGSLETILVNLFSNAFKYSPQNAIIELSIEQFEHNCRIVLKDNGVGIKKSDHKIIFNRFTRLNEINLNVPGSGIGLALVKEIVEQNGGRITVESTINEGASFIVTLPLQSKLESNMVMNNIELLSDISPEVALLKSINTDIEDTTSKDDGDESKSSILIIEDNHNMRNYLFSLLKSEFYCIAAADGLEGIDLANNTLPDIIISDVMMPQKDGFEVAMILKNSSLTCHIPIILLSAKNELKDRLRGWEECVDEYIPKPFHPEELKLRIRNILSIRMLLRNSYSLEVSKRAPQLTDHLPHRDQNFIDSFEKAIEKLYKSSELRRSDIASLMAMSERQLSRKLLFLVNIGFSDYLMKYRLRKATEILGQNLQVNQICYEVGFNSPSYFSKCFKEEYGKTVKQFENTVHVQ